MTKLLKAVLEKNNALGKKPLLLKIAPDLTEGQLDDIIDIINSLELDGIVATNTTISRDGLRAPKSKVEAIGAGGLSGKVLRERSTEVITYLRARLKDSIAIIAVGGIFTGADAKESAECWCRSSTSLDRIFIRRSCDGAQNAPQFVISGENLSTLRNEPNLYCRVSS